MSGIAVLPPLRGACGDATAGGRPRSVPRRPGRGGRTAGSAGEQRTDALRLLRQLVPPAVGEGDEEIDLDRLLPPPPEPAEEAVDEDHAADAGVGAHPSAAGLRRADVRPVG